MRAHRIAALIIIVAEAVTLAMLWGVYAVPVLACALAAVATFVPHDRFARLRDRLSPERRALLGLVVGAVVLVKWRMFPHNYFPRIGMALPQGLSPALAGLTMLMQAAYLVFTRKERLSASFLLLGVIALELTGDISASRMQDIVYQTSAIVFCMAAAWFAWSGRATVRNDGVRPSRRGTVIAVILLVVACAGAMVPILYLREYSYEIDRYIAALARNAPVGGAGLSRSTQLDTVINSKLSNPDGTALRVVAHEEPGYLRAHVRDAYSDGRWDTRAAKDTLRAAPDAPEWVAREAEDRRVFEVRAPADAEALDRLEVWPVASVSDVVCAPLTTAYLATATDFVESNAYRAMAPPSGERFSDYVLYSGRMAPVAPLNEEDLASFMNVPEEIGPRITALAERLCTGMDSPHEKIAAVVGYLTGRHEYGIGIDIPDGRDPLAHFLLTDPPLAAHCEYFASAAAVLLRLGGVPTRYVTGYLVTSKNPRGGYWVARNKDAHAWVEAYVPDRGWIVVEATPGGGVPVDATPGWFSQWWDALKFQLQQLRAAIMNGDWRAALVRFATALLKLAVSVPGLIVLLLLGGGIGRRIVRRRAGRTPDDPVLRRLRQALSKTDARMRRKGLVRGDQETLMQFADRIVTTLDDRDAAEHIAAWYRTCAAVRYRPPLDVSAVDAVCSEDPFAATHDAVKEDATNGEKT
ncbi:MAG: transglutaminase domain-containing protein [bacterium]|nr:transglutaminase domain-containing protein [bacterium]